MSRRLALIVLAASLYAIVFVAVNRMKHLQAQYTGGH